jgi:hypothetical protein
MSDIIQLDLDCVTGEKLMFRRSNTPGALVEVTLNDQQVSVKPQTLLLALLTLQELATTPSSHPQ